MAKPVDLVLFDLGGVLVEVRGVHALRELTGMDSEEQLWQRWLTCRWVRRFERGGCSEQEFAVGLVADWQLQLSPEEFLQGFRDWPTGPLPGAAQLVADTSEHVATGCFSNTNTLHWHDHIAAWPLVDRLQYRLLSFELGVLKPDVEAFRRVADLLEIPAERVLFLDDNAVNVAGARAAGFQALQAVGTDQARERLVQAEVLGTTAA